ncbi:substrate-binding periplasmic protein [Haliovirga abyssi]|uniref:Solute-binding protein family 3/N-terminal domain-containing protein n=1 Tax=Haliovirga abyssi TaxID=2996794 RepID=A0AAU9DH32_9FUSO|nr:transporter substrate-binding domain-containing protein [Haliovirga abyssi]BDU51608.1 hypothetical protein HLVA_21770 [Haliovirga abyssi]
MKFSMKKSYIFLILFFTLTIISSSESNLNFIAEENYPPISFLKNGKPAGLAVEIVREMLKRKNIPDNIKVWPWVRGYRMTLHHPNYVLFSVARIKERENLFKWVGPIYKMEVSFYGKKNSKIIINSINDAKKLKRIGVFRDSFEEQLLKKRGFNNLDSAVNNILNTKKLMGGRYDVMIFTNTTIKSIVEKAGYSLNDVKKLYTFTTVSAYIAFSKDTPDETISSWQKTLDEMKKEGVLEKIEKKWLE